LPGAADQLYHYSTNMHSVVVASQSPDMVNLEWEIRNMKWEIRKLLKRWKV